MGYIELDVLDSSPKRVVIGIDLGTTNSLPAIWKDGRPEVLRIEGEAALVPSVVHVKDDGTAIVGRSARARSLDDPAHTVHSVKRFMGRSLADIEEADLARLPYGVSETERGLVQIEVRGKRFSPQELSALVLREVCAQATVAMDGAEVMSAVITVPAYFDDAQRQATRDAARLAGIEVLRIINEPTAASLAYGLDQRKEGNVAVYDLGGGTFDVSILSIEEGVFQVLSTGGDTRLGGDDIDAALMDLVAAELRGDVPAEVFADPAYRQAARLASEKAKIALSSKPEADLTLSLPELGVDVRRRITREEFDALITPLVERSLASCTQALADAKLSADQIDEVVLVGGSTRVPLVRERVAALFGREPHTELNPDEVVALGAAAQAEVLMGGSRDILLMDVTPLSLGLETMGGAAEKLIQRNSRIPCSVTEGFTTYADGQTAIDFHVLQGEREMAADCRSLGRFKLTGIPPMPAGMARVGVKFHLDADGILTVTAKEESTGTVASIEVKPSHGLTEGEIETMLEQSFANARKDFDERRRVDLIAEIGTMLRHTEANLDTARARLDAESVEDLVEAIAAAKEAQRSDDLEEVQAARDVLDRATMPLATVLMDGVVKEAVSGKKLGEL
ncbi:MAG: Fe-S protein assembly chaperone HscA [Planctomycetota bacterium]|nr:Fe-S protein assembly chaperone HscA [Planctomycetota bacterium]